MSKSKQIESGIEVLQELASNTGVVLGAIGDTTGQAVPAVASMGLGAGLDAVDMFKAINSLGQDAASLAKQAKSELDYKAAKKDPQIQALLGMRSYANGMLKLQHAAEDQAQQKLAGLDKFAVLAEQFDADPNMELPDGLTPDEGRMLSMSPDERTQAIETRKQDLGQQIEKMQQAAAQLDVMVNAVNSHPRISSPEFRKLEAKHDLENNLGKAGAKTVRDMMNVTKSGVGLAGNALGAASTVMTVAGVGGAVAASALGAASAGATIAGGAMMVAGGTAGMAAAAYKHHELSKVQQAAGVAAKDSMQMAQGSDDPDSAVEMAFAMSCVEENARQGKNIEKLKFVRNAGVAVAGVGVTTMGTGALLSAAGAAGYGAGATPGLILTGVGAGVAAGGGAVALGAQVGISGYKKYQSHLMKQDVGQAQLALQAQDIMMKLATTEGFDARDDLESQLTPEHLKALDNMKQGLKTTLKGLGVDDKVIAQQLNDASQVAKFASCVMIQRDPKLASETIAKAALNECQGAFLKRAQGGATAQGAGMAGGGRAVNIIEADLPKDSPAINALRKLGMDDRKITQTMNAMANHDTRQIAQKTLQKQTALK